MTVGTRILHRRDTAADWTSNNPTLAPGEPALETDTGRQKIGDGSTAWTGLPYASVDPTLNGSDFADAGSTRANVHVPVLASCQAAATANLTLSGTQTVDGYAAAVGDQILAAGQTTASQNGPWVVASGAWTRPTDYAHGASVKGRSVQVNNGTLYDNTVWVMATGSTVIVDTTATTWAVSNQAANDSRYTQLNPAGLVAWTNAQSFNATAITRDANEAIVTATVVWPDGGTGTFTTDTASTLFPGAIDAYHVTYVNGAVSHTITQSLVTRDANGAVTAQPALVVT